MTRIRQRKPDQTARKRGSYTSAGARPPVPASAHRVCADSSQHSPFAFVFFRRATTGTSSPTEGLPASWTKTLAQAMAHFLQTLQASDLPSTDNVARLWRFQAQKGSVCDLLPSRLLPDRRTTAQLDRCRFDSFEKKLLGSLLVAATREFKFGGLSDNNQAFADTHAIKQGYIARGGPSRNAALHASPLEEAVSPTTT